MGELVVIEAEQLRQMIREAIAETSSKEVVNSTTIPEIVSEKDLAKFLKVSIPTVQKLRKNGKIPFIMIESTIRYNINEVIKELQNERERKREAA